MKKKNQRPKKSNSDFVSKKRARDIDDTFKLLGIKDELTYQGAVEYSKNFKRASVLDSEGVIYTTSSSSV